MSARERLYLERKAKLLGLRRSRVCILSSSTTVDMTGCDIGDNYVSWQVCVCGFVFTRVSRSVHVCACTHGDSRSSRIYM